jgi:hypothetical protein
VHWICYDTTALDIEVDPKRCLFGSLHLLHELKVPDKRVYDSNKHIHETLSHMFTSVWWSV